MANVFLSLIGISASVSLIAAALILLAPLLNKRYAAKWKYLIWIFLAIRLLIPFSGAGGESVMNALAQLKTGTASAAEKNIQAPSDAAVPYRRIIVEIPAQMTAPIAVQSGADKTGITPLDVAAYVWLSGSLILISVHFFSYIHYKRQVRKKGNRIDHEQFLSQLSGLKRELHIRQSIQVTEYDEAASPMVIGFLKPVLVLPKEQYSAEQLFFILKHELIHLKRKDVYFKLLFVIANAVHWFNPIIWMMQKEAAIDMELSCDERVVRGAGYDVRKAYTETLLSMLHKRCAGKTVLSTQFYGGMKTMKSRFKNILTKNTKKNGIFIFICAVILTFTFGAVTGCSVRKEDAETELSDSKDAADKDTVKDTVAEDGEDSKNVPDSAGQEDADQSRIPSDDVSSDNHTPENTTVLTFTKEGEQEEKQASLAAGNGFSFFLPDHEWKQSGADEWTAAVSGQVRIWVTHFENKSMDAVRQELEDSGYVTGQDSTMRRQEENLVTYASLKQSRNDVWGVFYCYPPEAEEGWGKELPVIADTFALTITEDHETGSRPDDGNEYLEDADCEEIKNTADEFAAAYFEGNKDVISKLLAGTYEGDIEIYESTGSVSDITLKGLSDTDEKKIENNRYAVSLQFRDSTYEDMFWYLTVLFVREGGSWKVQSYGIEG